MGKIPNVFVIVFFLIILSAALTWIVPGGSYERRQIEINNSQRTVVVEGTYEKAESDPQILEVFTAPLKGFIKLAEIIGFIFIVGGAFYILNETGAINAGIGKLVKVLKGKELLIIPIVMTVFSLFGAVFGMCEEAMPFVLIFVPLAISLGYDSIVGICLSFLAAGVGFAGAFINPFTLQIAQKISDIKPVSGIGYRVLIWILVTAFTVLWVMVYAAKIKKDPRKSIMYEHDQKRREALIQKQEFVSRFTWRHGACLGILILGVVFMVVGVILFKWYIKEIAGLFLAMGLSSAIIAGKGMNEIAGSFIKGCKEMVSAALVLGFVGGIIVILEQGGIMDTILFSMASSISKLPGILAADFQYFIQIMFNFFIPSGSTKAALTMPIMSQLADLSGITRQTAVLAYQFGDGFTNMIIPTSGVTIGTLAMAKIPYEKWFKWNFPMQIFFFIISLLLLVWPVLTNWQ
ncbi:MAG: putative basic amino acid antiporter YfcC [Candidatus Aminicenantes bacterium]|nr:putative basic amino acid antiporter YfcC [Candidatus Aminicenantes bacterium]